MQAVRCVCHLHCCQHRRQGMGGGCFGSIDSGGHSNSKCSSTGSLPTLSLSAQVMSDLKVGWGTKSGCTPVQSRKTRASAPPPRWGGGHRTQHAVWFFVEATAASGCPCDNVLPLWLTLLRRCLQLPCSFTAQVLTCGCDAAFLLLCCCGVAQVFYLGYGGLKQIDLSDDQVVAAIAKNDWENQMQPVEVRWHDLRVLVSVAGVGSAHYQEQHSDACMQASKKAGHAPQPNLLHAWTKAGHAPQPRLLQLNRLLEREGRAYACAHSTHTHARKGCWPHMWRACHMHGALPR